MKNNLYFWTYLSQFSLKWEMFKQKLYKIQTHILCSITFFKFLPLKRQCGENLYSRAAHRWQYGTRSLHAGYLNLQTHTQNMYYMLLFHCNNIWTNAPECYVIGTLHVLWTLFAIVCNYTCCQFHSSGLVCLLFLYICGDFVIGLHAIKPARK